MINKKMKELEQLCRPVANYLKNNWDPHCTIVITDNHIKLVRDEMGIPIGTAQEVPVQEQCNNSIIIKIDSIVINQEFDYKSFLSRLDKNLLSGLKR